MNGDIRGIVGAGNQLGMSGVWQCGAPNVQPPKAGPRRQWCKCQASVAFKGKGEASGTSMVEGSYGGLLWCWHGGLLRQGKLLAPKSTVDGVPWADAPSDLLPCAAADYDASG